MVVLVNEWSLTTFALFWLLAILFLCCLLLLQDGEFSFSIARYHSLGYSHFSSVRRWLDFVIVAVHLIGRWVTIQL
jgi:hypothetical protein